MEQWSEIKPNQDVPSYESRETRRWTNGEVNVAIEYNPGGDALTGGDEWNITMYDVGDELGDSYDAYESVYAADEAVPAAMSLIKLIQESGI